MNYLSSAKEIEIGHEGAFDTETSFLREELKTMNSFATLCMEERDHLLGLVCKCLTRIDDEWRTSESEDFVEEIKQELMNIAK